MVNCRLLLIFVLAVVVLAEEEDKCIECNRNNCPHIHYCPFGVTLDSCGCCEVCYRELAQSCGEDGKCGEFLTCTQKNVCKCEEEHPVCGSDGKTYDTLCELMKETKFSNELSVVYRDTCRQGPVIKTAPKDKVRPNGSILVLECEASGFPVPSLTWELNRDDGTTIKLPGDDSLFAIQTRGGPEKNMATGWVQIMKVTSSNVGHFTCIASNDKGEARASAKITIAE